MKPSRETKWLLLGGAVPVLLLAGGLGWNWYKTVPPLEIRDATLPSPNAYDTFKKAALSLKMPPYPIEVDPVLGWTDSPPYPPEVAAKRRYPPARREFWLSINKSSFAAFERGLQQAYRVPRIRHYKQWSENPYSKFEDLSRALRVKIHAHNERGDYKGAVQTALDLMQFGLTIPRTSDGYAFQTGQAFEMAGRRELWKLLPHLDAPTAAKSARRLEALLAQRVSFAEMLREERLARLIDFLELCSDEQKFTSRVFDENQSWKTALRFRLISPRIIFDNYSRAFDHELNEAKKPYSVQLKQKVVAHAVPPMRVSLSDPLTARIFQSYSDAQLIDFHNRAESNLLCAALALRAFRLQNGRYPQSLKELTPRYLRRVPADPLAPGRALGYQPRSTTFVSRVVVTWKDPQRLPRLNQGASESELKKVAHKTALPYTLYSIGDDARDDGGTPLPDNRLERNEPLWGYNSQDSNKGDFIAGLHTSEVVFDWSRVNKSVAPPIAYAAANASATTAVAVPLPPSEAAIRAALAAAPPTSALPPTIGGE